MITFTAPTPRTSEPPRRRAAFTLVETIVAVTLGTILMAAVFSVIVMQARLSTSVGNYADLNAGSRQAMSLFEREMRTAKTIAVMESDKVEGTLTTSVAAGTLADKAPGYTYAVVTYAYDKGRRTVTRAVDGQKPVVVLSDVESFSFRYFNKNDAPAVTTADIKKILISATLRRTVQGTANSDYLVSAMVTMRNRIVTS